MHHKIDWEDGDIVKPEDFNRIEKNNQTLEASKSDKSITKNIILSAAGWTGKEAPYSYTVPLEEATETNNVEINAPLQPTPEQYEQLTGAGIFGGTQTEGSITLSAYGDKPAIDLPVIILIRGD